MPWYQCTVNGCGPAFDGNETAQPVVYINLTDGGGAFNDQWFHAAENSRHEMLATALAAIAGGRQVTVAADPPPYPTYPMAQRFYIVAN
jgi:hypothetical protein